MGLRKSNYDERGVDLSEPKVYEDIAPKSYYNYDDNGELVGEGASVIVYGQHIVPAKTTEERPPTKVSGKARVFDESSKRWEHVTDARGDTVYDTGSKEAVKVDYLGDIKSTQTKLVPPSNIHKFKNGEWDLSTVDHQHDLERKLMRSVDAAHDEAENLALGYKSTSRQIERYADKFQRAVKGEFSSSLNKAIIAKHKTYQNIVGKRVDVIETLRSMVSTLIREGNLERAENIINKFSSKEGGYALNEDFDEGKFEKEFEKITR